MKIMIMLEVILYIMNGVLSALLIIMFRQLIVSIREGTPPRYRSELGRDTDLPSVTVCIPARNEAHALMDCLDKVIASKYDKLEIIVLDDVSGDDTSALIKSYASEGVRFVQGKTLPSGWVGKNHALQGLLEEASGTYVLFMDVDTRLAPHAVEHLVRYAVSSRATMVSVIPRREDRWRASIYGSTLRYFWELIFNRTPWPATSSNAWLIRRETLLKRFQGFDLFKSIVQPEAKIAAELAKTQEYRYLIGSHYFGFSFEKKWRSQLITSVRLIYPLLGGQKALAVLAALDLLLLLAPFVTIGVIAPLIELSTPLLALTASVCIGYSALYGYYAHRMWRHGWLLGALLWPLIVLQECLLIFASVFQYSRRTVKWKGRLIRPAARS